MCPFQLLFSEQFLSKNHTLKEVKKFFKKNKIKILKKENPINLDNEINVYF